MTGPVSGKKGEVMKRTKLLFSLLLLISVFTGFIITGINSRVTVPSGALHVNPPPPTSGNISTDFLIAAMNDGADHNFQYISDSLGLNLWHWYCGDSTGSNNRHYPDGWTFCAPNDHLFNPVGDYQSGILSELSDIGSHNMQAFIHRPKIDYLCYGQRSDYRCVDTLNLEDKDLWFYSFQSPGHIGSDIEDGAPYGDGRYVRFCNATGPNPDDPGFVVSRLRTNNEQCHINTWTDQWRYDNECDWYIKPRIRIDSTIADNPANWNTNVCRVIVIGQSGTDTLKMVTLKVRNFLDNNDNYDGKYLEEYRIFPGDDTMIIHVQWGDNYYWSSRGNHPTDDGNINKADIQVYWYGNCDMWIDYVRVDNNIAHNLFSTDTTNLTHRMYDQWLNDEAVLACEAQSGVPLKFYIELNEFNNIPAIAYVNQKLNQYCGKDIDMIADQFTYYQYHMNWDDRGKIMTADQIVKEYVTKIGMKQVYPGCFPFLSVEKDTVTYSRIPNTLPINSGENILAQDVSPADYDAWLQGDLDTVCTNFQGEGGRGDSPSEYCNRQPQLAGMYQWVWKLANRISKQADIPIIGVVQAHQWVIHCGEVDREPTNEELDLTTNLPITYGAKGLVYEIYDGHTDYPKDSNYWVGFTETDGHTPRYTNYYGQPKWEKFKSIVQRLKKWGPTIMSFDNTQTNSYIYRFDYSTVNSSTIFTDIQTFAPDPVDEVLESYPHRYLQAATFFNPNEAYSKYFMLVNKRCSPYRPEIGETGGYRHFKAIFNASYLTIFNNWKVINVEDNSTVATFDKSANTLIDLSWYLPGEGKLYRLAPVMQEGGTLIVDEDFGGVSFDCKGVVHAYNPNITIGLGTTINFRDTAKISMQGGTFLCGNYSQPNGPRNIQFKSSYSNWDGLEFDRCDIVNISNTVFENIKPSIPADSINYAVKLISCYIYNISNNTFTNLSGFSSGAINSTFYGDVNPAVINPYIAYNTFDMNTSNRMIVKIQSYASNTVPVLIDGNTFTSTASSSQAIYLSGVTGGAIKNNSITGFSVGINTLESDIDIYQNNITNTTPNSTSNGIYGCALSSLNMSTNISWRLAGFNQLTNTGTSANNLNLENSYFFVDNGENIFNISLQSQGKHLYGYFPPVDPYDVYATNNCFQDNGSVTTPVHDVTWGAGGEQVNFIFTPFLPNCMPGEQGSDMIVNLGNGVYDTIPVHSGSGGSMKGIFIITAKSLYDSICIETRKRNYGSMKSKCTNLLNIFPDSIQSLDAISKLYIGVKMTDTSASAFNSLKTFYESLILNHANNIPLVKKCNYMVQKCKVQLRQYTSAMTGFQQIINENPYSYEGLVAKWDYMATHLLDSLSAGGEPDDGEGPHDKFTKEQRQTIKTSIGTALEDSKIKEEKKIENLTELALVGDLGAAKLLQQKMVLKNIIKTEHPHNISEHIRIVNSDIRKLYGQTLDEKGKSQNAIPSVFRLSQNYPNPFNPVTKIQYDLPKDVKVKLIIYDILGREVIRLVNNEFKQAGRYMVEFNGNNYASGVYFYRIEADNFVQSKKMVLIK